MPIPETKNVSYHGHHRCSSNVRSTCLVPIFKALRHELSSLFLKKIFSILFAAAYHPYGSGNVRRNQSPRTEGCLGRSCSKNTFLFFSSGSFIAEKQQARKSHFVVHMLLPLLTAQHTPQFSGRHSNASLFVQIYYNRSETDQIRHPLYQAAFLV